MNVQVCADLFTSINIYLYAIYIRIYKKRFRNALFELQLATLIDIGMIINLDYDKYSFL